MIRQKRLIAPLIEAVIHQHQHPAVRFRADQPARRLAHLLHARIAVGKAKAVLKGLLHAGLVQRTLRAHLGQTHP